jgi:hypothetical protein
MISTSTDSSCLSSLLPFSAPFQSSPLKRMSKRITSHSWRLFHVMAGKAASTDRMLRIISSLSGSGITGKVPFLFEYDFVGCDAGYEEITLTFCLSEQIEMSDKSKEASSSAGTLPANTGRKMRFTGTTILKVVNGKIAEEIGLDDGVTALTQLGILRKA